LFVRFFYSACTIGSIATLIRTFRIGRIFRLIKSAQSLRIIFGTLIQSLPALFNVGALLGLSFFIFTAIGVQLFAKVGWVEGGSMDEHANFASFPTALLTLLRMATGEAWPDMMYDLKDGPEECDAAPVVTRESCGFEVRCSFLFFPLLLLLPRYSGTLLLLISSFSVSFSFLSRTRSPSRTSPSARGASRSTAAARASSRTSIGSPSRS
jgi:hypothetical protein